MLYAPLLLLGRLAEATRTHDPPATADRNACVACNPMAQRQAHATLQWGWTRMPPAWLPLLRCLRVSLIPLVRPACLSLQTSPFFVMSAPAENTPAVATPAEDGPAASGELSKTAQKRAAKEAAKAAEKAAKDAAKAAKAALEPGQYTGNNGALCRA